MSVKTMRYSLNSLKTHETQRKWNEIKGQEEYEEKGVTYGKADRKYK